MNEIGNNENNIEKDNLIYEYLKNKDIIKILEINKNPGSTDDYYNFINYEDNIDGNIISTNIGNIYDLVEYDLLFNNNLFLFGLPREEIEFENTQKDKEEKVDNKKFEFKKEDEKKKMKMKKRMIKNQEEKKLM